MFKNYVGRNTSFVVLLAALFAAQSPLAHANSPKMALASVGKLLAGNGGRALVESMLADRESSHLMAKILGEKKSEFTARNAESVRSALIAKLNYPDTATEKKATTLLGAATAHQQSLATSARSNPLKAEMNAANSELAALLDSVVVQLGLGTPLDLDEPFAGEKPLHSEESPTEQRTLFPSELLARVAELYVADSSFRADLIQYTGRVNSRQKIKILTALIRRLGAPFSADFEQTRRLLDMTLDQNMLGDISSGHLDLPPVSMTEIAELTQVLSEIDPKFAAQVQKVRTLLKQAANPFNLPSNVKKALEPLMARMNINAAEAAVRGYKSSGKAVPSDIKELADYNQGSIAVFLASAIGAF